MAKINYNTETYPFSENFINNILDMYMPIKVDPKLKMKILDKASDKQVGGDHYKFFKIQPYQYCFQNKLNNLQSEVISYVSRYDKKWPDNKAKQLEDLEKAIHSIELLIQESGLK